SFLVWSQDDLLALLEEEQAKVTDYALATFKGTRVINGHSVEVRSKHSLEMIIGHRFGRLNDGVSEFWGLDQAWIRLGLEYGITDNLTVGIGRSSFDKVLDGFLKYRLLRQSSSFPFTITAFGSVARKTREDLTLTSIDRMTYTSQLLIARKLTSSFSLQIMPTMIQRNFVEDPNDANLLLSTGVGGRLKLSQRMALVGEYYPQFTAQSERISNVVAFGIDIETGGHVFQLHFTNAVQMNERGFIGETTGDFFNGDVHYGFNVTRVFDLKPEKIGTY
ncbi:MAG: DUF5777 family beta-barrel protein, partial [Bacteroidota bacterium]